MLTNPLDLYGMADDVFDEFVVVQRIGHCVVALILAMIAGLVGSYVAGRCDLRRTS
jgi:hypothetical protein